MVNLDVFDKQKKESLTGLDHSKKGTFDAPIHDLIVYINSLHDFFTTSSCSGRIIVFVEGDAKKKGCKWLVTSHDVIQHTQVIEAIEGEVELKPIVFKCESFILHVQCRTQEVAQEMLKVAMECGYRNSGLMIGKKKKIMLAVRTSHGLEVPLVFNNQVRVSNEYIEELVKLANSKLEENFIRINKFFDRFKATFKDVD